MKKLKDKYIIGTWYKVQRQTIELKCRARLIFTKTNQMSNYSRLSKTIAASTPPIDTISKYVIRTIRRDLTTALEL